MSMDTKLPHDELRVRVHGSTLVAQPYSSQHRYGNPLLIDLETGTIALGAKMIDLTTDYMIVRAIFGVQRLRTGVAVPVATAAEAAATVNGETAYRVTKCMVLTAHGKLPEDKSDKQLVALLQDLVSPHGIGAGLYFATEFNLTCATQVARAADSSRPLWQRSADDFWFNAQLSEPLCHAGAHQFVMPAILGFVKQFSELELTREDASHALTLTLIARRGRFRAGTRHWRRGIDGNVANFVETEQIAETGNGELAAYVQIRGSIPVCWSQVPNTKYKPPTVIGDDAAAVFGAFSQHAKALSARYGAVTAINLCNGHGSEGGLKKDDAAFSLVAFDFHKECGKVNYENLSKLWGFVEPAAKSYGSLRVSGELGSVASSQRGVLRTNCVDCLDRTNVAQAYFARKQLESLLRSLHLLGSGEKIPDRHPALEQRFRVLWADHGDALSAQYAGTGALKAGFTRTGKRTTMGMLDDGVKSAVRYYLNNYEDGRKQDSYDLACGTYKPRAAPLDTLTKRRSSGAVWVLLSFFLISTSLLSLFLAPLLRSISVLNTTLPMLAIGCVAFAVVLGMGGKVVCWPVLRPDLVQPWLPDSRQNGLKTQKTQ